MFERLKHIPLINSILRRPPVVYAAARRKLVRLEGLTLDGRRAWHNEVLTKVLSTAATLKGNASAPAQPVLSSWPISTKSKLAGHEQDFTRRSLLPLVQAATGGTTGQPLSLARSWRNVAMEQATIDHICAKVGIDARIARIAILRGDSIKPPSDMTAPFWVDEGLSRRTFSAHHLNRQTIHHYKAALQSFRPQILFCYPSSLANFLALMDGETGLHIPLVFASSEMMNPGLVEKARAQLGANVVDYYGHAERIACAWSLNGEGFNFLPAYGHVELIPEGPGLARLVATSLIAQGQIFVRYDTGDLVRVPSHDPDILDAIALGTKRFDGIEGRDNEYIDLPDGRRIIGLNHIPRGVHGAVSVQLFRSAPWQLGIYIVADKGFDHNSLEKLMSNVRQKFPTDFKVLPIFVERSVRERNGKAPLLLRSPDPSTITLSSQFSNHHLENVA